MKTILLAVALILTAASLSSRVAASDPGSGDWPMWGGTPDRNMVSNMKGLPVEWDLKTKKNVKWMAELGSQSYGNPVVAGGRVCVGTNNEGLRDPKQPGDRGVLMAFREALANCGSRPARNVVVRSLAHRDASSPASVHCYRAAGSSGVSTSTAFATGRTTAPSPMTHRSVRSGRHLVVRHDGRSRIVPAQPLEFVASRLRRSRVRERRTGRTKATSTFLAEGAAIIALNRTPESWCGRTTRSRIAFSTGSGRRRPSARSRRRSGGERAGRRLGPRLRVRRAKL
jgi:hypothetical protein